MFLAPSHDLARHYWTDPVNRLKFALICSVEINWSFTATRSRCYSRTTSRPFNSPRRTASALVGWCHCSVSTYGDPYLAPITDRGSKIETTGVGARRHPARGFNGISDTGVGINRVHTGMLHSSGHVNLDGCAHCGRRRCDREHGGRGAFGRRF